MRPFRLLTAVAALLVAATDASAQFDLARTGAGAVPGPGGAFPDAGFQYAYSFRGQAMSPGSDGASGILGASGACLVGEACSTATPRGFEAGRSSYFVGIEFGGVSSSPLFTVIGSDLDHMSELSLDGYTPGGTINAFYVLLRAADGSTVNIDNVFFLSPYDDAPGFSVTGGEGYGLYTFDGDLRDNILFFDLNVQGNAGDALLAPSIELYVGSMPVQVVPEPGTVFLTATGLVGVLVLARRKTALGSSRR